MKLLLRALIAIAFTSMFAVDAIAQDICAIITPYFTAAPTKFISERGERLDLDTWKIKTDIPRFYCELSLDFNLDLEKTYSVSCQVNEGAGRAVIAAYHEATAQELQSCIDHLSSRNQWKRESGQEVGSAYEYSYVTWEATNPSDKSRISLRAMRPKRTGREFNSIGWSYRLK